MRRRLDSVVVRVVMTVVTIRGVVVVTVTDDVQHIVVVGCRLRHCLVGFFASGIVMTRRRCRRCGHVAAWTLGRVVVAVATVAATPSSVLRQLSRLDWTRILVLCHHG